MPRPPAAQLGPASARAVEAEVRGNVMAQAFGAGTVADLALPEAFVRRVAGRVIVESYIDRYRAVEDEARRAPPGSLPQTATPDSVRVVRGVTFGRDAETSDERTDVPRNFGGPGAGAFSRSVVGSEASYEARRAQDVVTRRLARDGLLAASFEAARAAGAQAARDTAALTLALERAGVPTDLLVMFELRGADGFARGGCAEWIGARLRAGDPPGAVRARLAGAAFEPAPSLPGFVPTDDAGSRPPAAARLHLTRGDDWLGEGDGGSLDVARQIAALLPDVPLFVVAQSAHAAILAAHGASWQPGRRAPLTIIEEGLRVSQWAQDNARPGVVERDGGRVPAALLPRYASRRDELSAFVPGDTFAAESLGAAGFAVARSPLHFQGGNLLVVEDRARGERVLLIGEADVHRNFALGLTREQTLAALAAEMSADRCVVLPGVSYHLDYEVFVRTGPDGVPVAFVADARAAAQALVAAGIAALERSGRVPAGAASPERLDELWAALAREHDPARGFGAHLAACFSDGSAADPGAAGLAVFLEALDLLAAANGEGERGGASARLDGHTLAMFAARRRTIADRAALRRELEQLGWRVRTLAAMPAGRRGAAVLNALNAGPRVVLPTGPTQCAAVESAAAQALEQEGFAVTRVRTAESQRRHGAVRCAVALHA